jgi:hypothetical protein
MAVLRAKEVFYGGSLMALSLYAQSTFMRITSTFLQLILALMLKN